MTPSTRRDAEQRDEVLFQARACTASVCVMIRGEPAIRAHLSRHKLHMRVVGVKRAFALSLMSPGQPSRSFLTQINCSPMWALWSCGRRTSVVQAQRQIHRVAGPVHRLWPENASSDRDCGTTVDGIVPLRCDPWLEPILSTAALMPAEPHIRSPLPERLAPQSLIGKVIGLGRAGPHCMSAYHSHCL